MDELDDKNLRNVFGKLRNYESVEAGIEWSALQKQLPPTENTRNWKIVPMLFIVGLLLWVRPNGNKIELIEDTIERCYLTPAPAFDKISVGIQEERNYPLRAHRYPSPKRKQNKEKSHDPIAFELNHDGDQRSIKNEQPEPTESLPKHISIVSTDDQTITDEVNEIISEDSVAVENLKAGREEQAIRSKDKVFRLSAKVAYLFGVVTPNPYDQFVVGNYSSMPGKSLKANLDYTVINMGRIPIQANAFVQLVHKPFQFTVTEFGQERITSFVVSESILQPRVGFGISMIPVDSRWEFAVGLSSSLAKKRLDLMSRDWFSISLDRRLWMISKKSVLTVGTDVSLPISSQNNYFKYTPIQISIGIIQKK